MIFIGVVLLIVGLIAGIHVLFIAGLVLALIGCALLVAGSTGYMVGGRRHWY